MFKSRSLMVLIVLSGFLMAVGVISAQQGNIIHRVIEGDTLWDLAGRYFQNSFSWPLIWEANKDKIEDPHWIYPGQEFVIPPQIASGQIAQPDTVVAQAPEAQPETVLPDEPEVGPTKVATRAPRSTSFIQKPTSVVSERMAFESGFIAASDEKPAGHIVGSDRKYVEGLTVNDPVYINLGSRDGIKAGDKYAICRTGPGVSHPQSGKSLGKIVNIVGVLEVVDLEEKTSRAVLVKTYEPIRRNEALRPYEEIIVPKDVKPLPVQKSNQGCIVAIKQPDIAATEFKIVYIDKGLADGTMPGDVFEMYRSGEKAADPDRGGSNLLPELVVGQLQVLAVRNNTSSAFISNSSVEDIKVGEKIRLVKQVPVK